MYYKNNKPHIHAVYQDDEVIIKIPNVESQKPYKIKDQALIAHKPKTYGKFLT